MQTRRAEVHFGATNVLMLHEWKVSMGICMSMRFVWCTHADDRLAKYCNICFFCCSHTRCSIVQARHLVSKAGLSYLQQQQACFCQGQGGRVQLAAFRKPQHPHDCSICYTQAARAAQLSVPMFSSHKWIARQAQVPGSPDDSLYRAREGYKHYSLLCKHKDVSLQAGLRHLMLSKPGLL